MTGSTSKVEERTPFGLVAAVEPPVAVTERELVRISRELERAAQAGPPGRLLARGMQSWVAPGVVGGDDLDDDARSFHYAVTHDPEVVAAGARALGI